jgi:hypothetical protein
MINNKKQYCPEGFELKCILSISNSFERNVLPAAEKVEEYNSLWTYYGD